MESKCSRPPPPHPIVFITWNNPNGFFSSFFSSLCPLSTPLGGAHRLPLSENEIIFSVWLSKRQKKVIIIRSLNRCKKKLCLLLITANSRSRARNSPFVYFWASPARLCFRTTELSTVLERSEDAATRCCCRRGWGRWMKDMQSDLST